MKRKLPIIVAVGLVAAGAWNIRAEGMDEPGVVTGVGDCRDDQSLQIANVADNQARYACLQDKGVQQKCDLDGRTARLNAFRDWMGNLDRYQKLCEARHGNFAFKDGAFQEPRDETFCMVPVVSVSYGAFENPICNFVSHCPDVPVVCALGQNDLPGFHIPAQAILLPGVPVPVPLH